MDQNLINDFEIQLINLKEELEEIALLEKYYSQVPEEWKEDIQKMIEIKERIPKIIKIISKMKIL